MGRQEAYNALYKFFGQNETNTVHYHGDNANILECMNSLVNGQVIFDDAPDMYLVDADTVYIIEHFEFDCFKRTKKGSKYRCKEAQIDREFDMIEPTEAGVTFHATIKEESSYSHYLDNVMSCFNYHYGRIPNYIERLRDKGIITVGHKIKVVFMIEDVSPLGTVVFDRLKDRMEPVLLACSREFLEFYNNKTCVDYIIACSQCEKNDYVWFIDRSQIADYINNSCNYSEMEFLDFEPHEVRFKMIIPNE